VVNRAFTGRGSDMDFDRRECKDCRAAELKKGHKAGIAMSSEEKLRLRTYDTSKEEKRQIWKSVLAQSGKRMVIQRGEKQGPKSPAQKRDDRAQAFMGRLQPAAYKKRIK
jgi:hypothetical protein